MKHDELLEMVNFEIENAELRYLEQGLPFAKALRAAVELHKPKNYIIEGFEITESWCTADSESLTPYPCPTIKAIEEQLA